jgi:hypothetical protein
VLFRSPCLSHWNLLCVSHRCHYFAHVNSRFACVAWRLFVAHVYRRFYFNLQFHFHKPTSILHILPLTPLKSSSIRHHMSLSACTSHRRNVQWKYSHPHSHNLHTSAGHRNRWTSFASKVHAAVAFVTTSFWAESSKTILLLHIFPVVHIYCI